MFMTSAPTIPVPESVRSLLIFGGAFDPPHRAHIDLSALARDAAGCDWLLYVPAARAPLKDREPGASDADRLEMLRLALAGRDRTSVTDLEVRRGGVSYTIDTVRELRRLLPRVERFRLLIGADQAAKFHLWREPEEIIRLAEPLVMLRAPAEGREGLLMLMRDHWPPERLDAWRARIVEIPVVDASSTDVREVLRTRGPDDPEAARLLPEAVRGYIRGRGLYRHGRGGR